MQDFGILSSVFDLVTFYLFYHIVKTTESQFQTAWFLESLTTQTLVIHFIRTHHTPFIQSTASKPVLLSTSLCVVVGWIIPYSPLARYFKMEGLPMPMVMSILVLVVAYLILVEFTKRIFYKR